MDFEITDRATPNARTGQLDVNGKEISTPTHFTKLETESDLKQLVETSQVLTEQGSIPPLENTGGFVVDAQNTKKVLSDFDQNTRPTQTRLDGEIVPNFDTLLGDYGKCLIIDPNLDRLFYYPYYQDIPRIGDSIPDSITEAYESKIADSEDDGTKQELIETPREALNYVREETKRSNLCEAFLDLQQQYDPDVLLPPYYPIDVDSIEEDIAENIALYKITSDLASRFYDKPVAPVIALSRAIIQLEPETTHGETHPPQYWSDILNEYRETDFEMVFLKATNVEFDPDKLDKTNREGIVQFCKLLRRKVGKPRFFIGMDEMAYILIGEGLDGYSHPIYGSPKELVRFSNNDDSSRNVSRSPKYLVPRRWSREKFDQMDSLGCNCPFCSPFNSQSPSDISRGDQQDLRKRHWLWLRDEEIQEVIEAIQKGEIRPGLIDICDESEWKKNLTEFL